MSTAANIITRPTFTLADRMRIQRERIAAKEYKNIGFLTTVVQERQMSTRGLSQSRSVDRCSNPTEVGKLLSTGGIDPGMLPLSPWQMKAWALLTLDWLHHNKAPLLSISHDRNDLLLPYGLTPLPDIPDPAFVPGPVLVGKTNEVPRIPQLLEDRACGQIKERSGRRWLVFQPLTELCVTIGKGRDSGFGRIKCMTDPADRTHACLLVDPVPDDKGNYPAHFVGGSFHAGM